MVNLDDRALVIKIQGGENVIGSVNNFPKQLLQSWEESQRVSLPEDYSQVKNIVVCGMGGSRFPALIIKELFKEEITVPYLINDDYNLPAFVDENSLVILSSYSGTTEEVIECGKKALEKKAKLLGISAGGTVADFLKQNSFPYYSFNPVYNSSGQPRIGFGYSVGGHLGFLNKLGFIKTDGTLIEKAINNLSESTKGFLLETATKNNPAKQIALAIYQKYPYYVVSEFLTGIGNAIANQTNETAKSISSYRIIPEINHHLMEGLKHPDELKKLALFIFFFSKLYSPRVQKRFFITKEVVEKNGLQTYWYELKGESRIEQALELMALGGYFSMYLSTLYQEDPTVIPFVDYFKKKLSE